MYLCHVLTVYLGFIRCMKCAKVRAHNYLFSHAVVLTSTLNSKVTYYWTWNKMEKPFLNLLLSSIFV